MHFPFAYAYEGFIDRSRFPAFEEEIFPEMFKEGFLAANPDDFEEVELPASLHTAQFSSSKGYRFMIHVTHGEGEDMTESSLIYYFAWIDRRYKLVGMEIAG